jgi:thiamine biosynthesis lipoprotein
MSLDVGAVAKGYAIEKVAVYLENKGISGYLLNVGGNVRAIGTRGDGKAWNAGVENPDTTSAEPYIAQVGLINQAIATSGNYQRYYTVDGKNYHHIIDSSTLMPGENFVSVSVVCDDAGVADSLSTALFLMTYDEGLELSASLDIDEVIWVLPDGSIKKLNE